MVKQPPNGSHFIVAEIYSNSYFLNVADYYAQSVLVYTTRQKHNRKMVDLLKLVGPTLSKHLLLNRLAKGWGQLHVEIGLPTKYLVGNILGSREHNF